MQMYSFVSKLCIVVAAVFFNGNNTAWGLIANRGQELDASVDGAAGDPTNSSEEPHLSTNMLDRLIIVPEAKVMFCYIEKVGCKNFNDVFRYYRSQYDQEQANDPTWRRNTFEIHNFTVEDIQAAMKSKEWFKAVFYRDPLERVVAAWSSKCGGADKDGWKHCAAQFGSNNTPFEDTVEQIYQFDVAADGAQRGHDHSVNWTSFDPHWMRQADFCGGLWKTLPYYDVVEKLERDTSRKKVISMLKKVGVEATSIPHFNELFPLPGNDGWQNLSHNTGTEAKLYDFFPKDKPWLVETLVRHYSSDYNLFGIPPPDWAMDVLNTRLPWQLSGFKLPDQKTTDPEQALPSEMVSPGFEDFEVLDDLSPVGYTFNGSMHGSGSNVSSRAATTASKVNKTRSVARLDSNSSVNTSSSASTGNSSNRTISDLGRSKHSSNVSCTSKCSPNASSSGQNGRNSSNEKHRAKSTSLLGV